jgi:hypothetical protein
MSVDLIQLMNVDLIQQMMPYHEDHLVEVQLMHLCYLVMSSTRQLIFGEARYK